MTDQEYLKLKELFKKEFLLREESFERKWLHREVSGICDSVLIETEASYDEYVSKNYKKSPKESRIFEAELKKAKEAPKVEVTSLASSVKTLQWLDDFKDSVDSKTFRGDELSAKKSELEKLVSVHLGEDLDKKFSLLNMIKQTEILIEGDDEDGSNSTGANQ